MTPEKREALEKEFRHVINCHNGEADSNTPDFILAKYLVDCLEAFNAVCVQRETWYGRPTVRPAISLSET